MIYNNLHELVDTFCDTITHEEVAEIIYAHSTNKLDVREAALEKQSFEGVEKMLDLGCGFGFFTRALKNRVNPNTSIVGVDRCPRYQDPYLNSCKTANIQGVFDGGGVKNLHQHPDNTYDFIICSYAMYFFPDIIAEISRILKPNGTFVTITHSINHLTQLIKFIKETLDEQGLHQHELLPYENLIRNFSDHNGIRLLSESFKDVEEHDYKSTLIFKNGDFHNLEKYLRFKQPFYMPEALKNHSEIYDKIISRLCSKLEGGKTISVTKDDSIYICKNPF